MTGINRREFVQSVGAAAPIVATSASSRRVSHPLVPARPLDAKLLLAMGEAILPSELGMDGIARAVAEFQRWLRDYTPGAEALHGYGTGEIRRLPEDPAPRWAEQLTRLDRAATRQFSRDYAALDLASRRALVRDASIDDELTELPPAVSARHVAVGLLAHFYASPEATNLCYRTEISPYACRPLADSPNRPASRSPMRGEP